MAGKRKRITVEQLDPGDFVVTAHLLCVSADDKEDGEEDFDDDVIGIKRYHHCKFTLSKGIRVLAEVAFQEALTRIGAAKRTARTTGVSVRIIEFENEPPMSIKEKKLLFATLKAAIFKYILECEAFKIFFCNVPAA